MHEVTELPRSSSAGLRPPGRHAVVRGGACTFAARLKAQSSSTLQTLSVGPCCACHRGRAAESRAKEAMYGGEDRPLTPQHHGKRSAHCRRPMYVHIASLDGGVC